MFGRSSSGLRQFVDDSRIAHAALAELADAAAAGDAAHAARLARASLLRLPSLHVADRAYLGSVFLLAFAASALALGATPGSVRAVVRVPVSTEMRGSVHNLYERMPHSMR